MPTDFTAIGVLTNQIADLVQILKSNDSDNEAALQQIVVAAEQLAIAAREPDENVYHIGTQIAHNAALRSVIEMGVFDELPVDSSPMSTHVLAERLQVNEDLLGRLLRALTSTHLFLNPAPNHFAHTPLSLCYTDPSSRAMTAQMYDFTCQGVSALPKFLKASQFASPGTYSHNAFQLGAGTNLGFWEFLNEVPSRMELFSKGMRARTTIGSGQASGAFPFAEALKYCREEDVAVVDIGGGRGQALEAVWSSCISGTKGQFVLQDLPQVIEDGLKKGLPEWMKTSKSSFFEDQPVKGAYIYYFRRIFHDWDQELSCKILSKTKKAMLQHSRVLIADMVLPDVNAPRDMALQDLNMMSFGGMERSEAQWKELLGIAGLVLRKVWKGIGGTKHAVLEAVLPDFSEAT